MKIIFKIFKFQYLSGKLPGRLTIANQVEKPPSEENIDPCSISRNESDTVNQNLNEFERHGHT